MMISINPFFFLSLGVACFFKIGREFLIIFAVAFLHELAHFLCAFLFKCKDCRIKVMPWGVCLSLKGFKCRRDEIITSAAGPFLNLLLLFVFGIIKEGFLFNANLYMLIINLLPVYPLDGGRILNCFLCRELENETAKIVIRLVSGTVCVFLFALGILLFYKTKINFSVLLAAFFLSFTGERELSEPKTKRVKKIKHYSVHSDDFAEVILKIAKNRDVVLDIIDEKNRFLGSLTAFEVMEEISKKGYKIKFSEILQKH